MSLTFTSLLPPILGCFFFVYSKCLIPASLSQICEPCFEHVIVLFTFDHCKTSSCTVRSKRACIRFLGVASWHHICWKNCRLERQKKKKLRPADICTCAHMHSRSDRQQLDLCIIKCAVAFEVWTCQPYYINGSLVHSLGVCSYTSSLPAAPCCVIDQSL